MPLHDRADLLERLKVPAIIKPRVARSDPPNPIRLDVVVQKPGAGVDRRLARPENGIIVGRTGGRRQVVDGNNPGARCHIERAGVRGRDRRLQVAGVDDLATHRDIVKLSGGQVSDLLPVAPPQVLVAREHSDPSALR